MVIVYVIQSRASGRRYVGITRDLIRRLEEHNSGQSSSTKVHRPWEIAYQEGCETHEEARAREKYLKSAAGRRYLKKVLGEE